MMPSPIDSNASMLDSPPQHLVYNIPDGDGSLYTQHIYITSNEAEAQQHHNNVHYMLNTNNSQQQQQPQQSQQSHCSPAPSIGSDLTGSSSSPFAEVSHHTLMDMNVQHHHHQTQQQHLQVAQHQSQEHHHHSNNQSTIANNNNSASSLLSPSVDDELLEFVNWF